LFWLIVALALTAGTALAAIDYVARAQARKARAKKANADLRELIALTIDGELPRVSAVSPYGEVGVTRSKYVDDHEEPPYVHRLADQAIDAAVTDGRFTLVAGPSKAGKTRSAYEAIRRLRSSAALIIPRPEAGTLRRLLEIEPPLGVGANLAVLWLDDLERYLGAEEGIDAGLVETIGYLVPNTTIVATLNLSARATLLNAEGQVGRAARLVLDRATVIVLASKLTDRERREAQERYPKESFARGLGEELVAASLIDTQYFAARDAASSDWALLRSAVDWQRMGMFEPIPEADLRVLFTRYAGLTTDKSAEFQKALEWTTSALAPNVSLIERLHKHGTITYQAHDYVISLAEGFSTGEHIEIADSAWDYLISSVRKPALIRIGSVAMFRYRRDIARRAWEEAQAAEDPVVASAGTLNLGVLYADEGDVASAKEAYRQAGASLDAAVSIRAKFQLASLLQEEGDSACIALFEAVAASSEYDLAASALLKAGLFFGVRGLGQEAEPLLRRATETGYPDVAAPASALLGSFLAARGDTAGAKAAFAHAASIGRPVFAASAELQIAQLLLASNDREGAKEHLRQAIDHKDDDYSPQAELMLAGLQCQDGARTEARELFTRVVMSGHAIAGPRAMVDLATMSLEEGRIAEAQELFERALLSNEPSAAAKASEGLAFTASLAGDEADQSFALRRALSLGTSADVMRNAMLGSLMQLGNQVLALSPVSVWIDRFEQARALRDDISAGEAGVKLGLALTATSDLVGAIDAFRAVEQSDARQRDRAGAALNRGILETARGRDDAAIEAFERVALEGDSELSAQALINRATVYLSGGDKAEAKASLERALDRAPAGHVAIDAALMLGSMLHEEERDSDAARVYERALGRANDDVQRSRLGLARAIALESTEPDAALAAYDEVLGAGGREANEAALRLGNLLMQEDNTTGAAAAFQRSIDFADPTYSPRAALILGEIRRDAGELADARALYSRAFASTDNEAASRAALELARSFSAEGDSKRAEELLRAAYQRAHAHVAPIAAWQLALILISRDEREEAERLLVYAATQGDLPHAARAATHLGALLMEQGRFGDARVTLEAALLSGDPEATAVAALNLGYLYAQHGNTTRAREAFETAREAGNAQVAARASIGIGRILAESGDERSALSEFAKALESEEVDIVEEARREMRTLSPARQGAAGKTDAG
jgi:tetratricopeptide (TPR) repeat protein